MNPLLYKEAVCCWPIILAMLVAVPVYSIMVQSGPYVPFLFAALLGTAVAAVSTDSDERTGWTRYALSSGISRRQLVNSKFIVVILGTVVCQLVAAITAAIILAIWKGPFELDVLLPVLALSVAMGVGTGSMAVFVEYRFRQASIFVALLLAGSLVYILMFGLQGTYDCISDSSLFVAAVCAAFIVLAVLMYVMTRRTVDRRDFRGPPSFLLYA